jgi:hypothetical protein
MCSKAVTSVLVLALVLALVLGAGQTITSALAVEHGSGAVAGSHFGDNPFGHRGRHHHRIVVIPYSDYDGAPTDAYGNIAVYPQPAPAVPAPQAEPACHRTSETVNVPAVGGGTREITVIGCP